MVVVRKKKDSLWGQQNPAAGLRSATDIKWWDCPPNNEPSLFLPLPTILHSFLSCILLPFISLYLQALGIAFFLKMSKENETTLRSPSDTHQGPKTTADLILWEEWTTDSISHKMDGNRVKEENERSRKRGKKKASGRKEGWNEFVSLQTSWSLRWLSHHIHTFNYPLPTELSWQQYFPIEN